MPSSSEPRGTIRARGLGRRFELRDTTARSLKDVVLNRRLPGRRELWALRHLDLDIAPGETFGIVGQNGSGKSTLLKLIAGIFPPSEGALEIDGVVGSLLEVGAGFHPEFSGVENVYLNAAIYGIGREYVDNHLEEIIAFAELEEFAQMPVKTYSSGMYTRLGFSVAMHMQPDILLLDEVLAVGDEAFQHKCFGKIWDFKRAGGTIVFVSHSPAAVERLCDRAILLDHGRVMAEGRAEEVLVAYHKHLVAHAMAFAPPDDAAAGTSGACEIRDVRARAGDGTYRDRFVEAEPVAFELTLLAIDGLEYGRVVLALRGDDGQLVAGRETGGLNLRPGVPELLKLHLAALPLREGALLVDVQVQNHDGSAILADLERALEVQVFSHDPGALGPVRLLASWELPDAAHDAVADVLGGP